MCFYRLFDVLSPTSTRPDLLRRKIQMKSAANQRAVSISVMPLLAGRRLG